ncbi:MAG: D-alanine--D-alanine ligase [Romboutsia sp.]|uniref:D-alanine--D-alanine ligase n=1 Tax=Romboutsia sp. TaxID=1965302 RepID=UPI003F36F999
MKIAVIMGGISSEREVSLNSGIEVYNNLNRNKYEVVKIILDDKMDIFTKLSSDIDFAFLALHGKFGEDGCIQSILETMDIPYSGCGPLTSALCMDKNMTKKILRDSNLPTAPWLTVKSLDEINYDKINEIGYPVFIKPNCGGSSVATFFVHSKDDVLNAVKKGLNVDNSVMIEKYISGEEYTSFILNGEVFPTVSIKSNSDFFDYESKYSSTNGAIEEVIYLDDKLQSEINEISKTCWDIFNCKAYVRVDIIISNGVPYVLEINTLPGMTQTSLIPRSAKALGIGFSELLDKIIKFSLN